MLQMGLAAALLLAFSTSAIVLSSRTLERQEGAFLSRTATQLSDALGDEWSEAHDLGRAAEVVLREDAPTGLQIEIFDDHMRPVRATTGPATRHPADGMRSARAHLARGAWIVVSVSTRPRQRAIGVLSLVLVVVGLSLFSLTAVLSRALAQRMLRPLRRLAGEAARASDGGAIAPLARADDPSELRQLGAAFDLLLSRLDRMLRGERLFTQDAAHELRTPLTVVSGEIEYALSKLAPTDAQRTGLVRAADQVRTMSELVEALLFLRRSDAVTESGDTEFAPVNLSDLVRDAIAELLLRAPARASDVSVAAQDEAMVSGHATLLGSALRNLLGNALKFTAPGQAVRVAVHAGNGRASVTVEDAGNGIRAEDRGRVFDPFYRDAEARSSHDGFGLGLAILSRVARAHGGEVELEDSELGGARFELRLPAWKPSTARG
jgi:signal transduction histidine kinase